MKLLCVLLLVGSAVAQCPVQFDEVKPHDNHSNFDHYVYHFKIKWRNVSDKVIVGTKFHARLFDSTGDYKDTYTAWSSDHTVKPGEGKTSQWQDEYLVKSLGGHPQGEIWVEKARFSDGTIWEDDGSHQCKRSGK